MRVPKKIRDEIKAYCEINNIENIDPFIVEQIVKGFNITKYGNYGGSSRNQSVSGKV